MSFVLDANSFTRFRDHHIEFQPLWDWFLSDSRIKIVVGGTKYKKEIASCKTFIPLLNELKRKGKVFSAQDESVDGYEQDLKAFLPDDCDDRHLVALLAVSGCCLFVSYDRRADQYVKKGPYPDRKRRHIYRYAQNKNLLYRYMKYKLRDHL